MRGKKNGYQFLTNIPNVKGVEIGMVDIDRMVVDESYQRDINIAHIRAIAKDFNPRFLGAVYVAKRKYRQGFAILDGQHRVRALQKAIEYGMNVDPSVFCLVYTGLSDEEEAQYFGKYNEQKAISNVERCKVALKAKDPSMVNVFEIMQCYGFEPRLKKGRNPDNTNSISSMQIIAAEWRKAPASVSSAFRFLSKMNPQKGVERNGDAIAEICRFFQKNPHVSPERIAYTLNQCNVTIYSQLVGFDNKILRHGMKHDAIRRLLLAGMNRDMKILAV